ncbi:MAG: hypothetical protein KR126chlam1_00166 [Chlamydiae bacterium]|nr:hypothetical protein [Chlamydiota bacterium]
MAAISPPSSRYSELVYTSKKTLQEEMKGLYADLSRETPKGKLLPPKQEALRGYTAYELGSDTNLPFIILGAADIREDEDLLHSFGTLATEPQANEREVKKFLAKSLVLSPKTAKKITKNHLTRGSIVNDSNWSVFRNDMFMLGAIHAGKEFHVVTQKKGKISDKLLWDKKNNRPRVLGREIYLLYLHGFQRIDADKNMGVVFAPPAEPYKNLTLTDCRNAIASIKSVKDIREIFEAIYANRCTRSPLDSIDPNSPPRNYSTRDSQTSVVARRCLFGGNENCEPAAAVQSHSRVSKNLEIASTSN